MPDAVRWRRIMSATDDEQASPKWRGVVRRAGAGPAMGWACMLSSLLVLFIWVLAYGRSEIAFLMTAMGPLVAAVTFSVCAWFAAIGFGRTRQLRSCWWALALICAALLVDSSVEGGTAGHDVGLLGAALLIVLAFPASLLVLLLVSFFVFLFGDVLPKEPAWHPYDLFLD
jgi:hypothetical protein